MKACPTEEINMTSQQIAILCGVSRTTVSRVINNDPNVKDETRQMILSMIEQNNYVPIASARRLAGIDSNIIGLFIIDINVGQSTARVSKSTYFSQLGNLIIDQANNSGYHVLVSIITSDQQLLEARNLFASRTISGGVFIGAYNEPTQLDKILELEHPIIIIDRQKDSIRETPNSLVINLDNFMGGYEATQYLIGLGHTKIGHITGEIRKLSGKDRYEGYKKALLDANIPFDSNLVRLGEFQEQNGYLMAQELVKEQVTAIFCANDGMAIGAIKAIKELGLKVPKDISVIGFDNIEVGNYISPTLTTVATPLDEKAKKSISSLVNFNNNGFFQDQEIKVKTNMVLRESTQALK